MVPSCPLRIRQGVRHQFGLAMAEGQVRVLLVSDSPAVSRAHVRIFGCMAGISPRGLYLY